MARVRNVSRADNPWEKVTKPDTRFNFNLGQLHY